MIIGKLPASYKSLKPGVHNDGGGLYLQKESAARNSWIFKFQLRGRKTRTMGLGSVATVSLAEAREKARECRKLVADGIDPIEHRAAQKARNLAATAKQKTFDECAEIYVRQHSAAWTNSKHASQWVATLATYASPVIGSMPVNLIETPHILAVLEPIWTKSRETASRLRGRIERILDWATVAGYRSGANPARWRGHLDTQLAKRSKLTPKARQPALAYTEMPAFMAELRTLDGMPAAALEFLILTAVRSSDIRDARHADIDRNNATWTIPKLSKTGEELKVPLSSSALGAFDKARVLATQLGKTSPLAFPSEFTGGRLSDNAMLGVLSRAGRKNVTAHGFRSSFRSWAQNLTHFPREAVEQCLGHKIGNAVEAAYARGDMLKKRAIVMQAWADYCDRPVGDGQVISIAARK